MSSGSNPGLSLESPIDHRLIASQELHGLETSSFRIGESNISDRRTHSFFGVKSYTVETGLNTNVGFGAEGGGCLPEFPGFNTKPDVDYPGHALLISSKLDWPGGAIIPFVCLLLPSFIFL